MRILLVMDPGVPVPPKLYGGHERLVYMFAEEYIKMGHEVTVMASPESYCSGKTIYFGRNGLPKSRIQALKELVTIWVYLFFNHNKYDLIHNFGRLAYLMPILNKKVKKIMTYGRLVTAENIRNICKSPIKNLVFTGPSDFIVNRGNVAGVWRTVYNAIEYNKYTLVPNVSADAPMIFLGRLDKVKGCHLAIEVAKKQVKI